MTWTFMGNLGYVHILFTLSQNLYATKESYDKSNLTYDG